METYVSSMSKLRRMEDTQPEYKLVSLQSFLSSLYESAKIVCAQNGKTMLLQNEVSVPQLSIDSSFVSQVCDNLISNAVRYAGNAVTLSFALQNGGLLLSVSDDGKGFDKNNLHKVTAPYFTEETDHSEHFGLGLYICKLLCEHHGGYLKIDNISNGAKVSAFFKSPPCR
jgi:signal transduction histidine kinase